MIFIAALLCFAAVIWMLLRKRSHAESRPAIDAEVFDGENAGDLFQTAPIGYMEIDRKGMVRRVNRLECKLRGLDAKAMLGVHCAELIPTIERARYREHIQRKMGGHTGLVTYQREYPRENGDRVVVEVHEQLLRNKAGVVAGMRMGS